MSTLIAIRRPLVGLVFLSLVTASGAPTPAKDREDLEKPVYKVGRSDTGTVAPGIDRPEADSQVSNVPRDQSAANPMDQALEAARVARDYIRESIQDYTCMVVKQETVKGDLLPQEFFEAKIRHRVIEDGKTVVPFSVYLKFFRPKSIKGREVLYIEGRNDGNARVKEAGIKGRLIGTVSIKPDGMLAMQSNRYPITEIGIENLCARLVAQGPDLIDRNTCQVKFIKGARLQKRSCTCFQLTHPHPVANVQSSLVRVFHDDEYQFPVRYAAYDFPCDGAEHGEVLESYTYLDMKLNVGLTDADFDEHNPNYHFH